MVYCIWTVQVNLQTPLTSLRLSLPQVRAVHSGLAKNNRQPYAVNFGAGMQVKTGW